MKVKSVSEVAQSCPTLSDPMDCSLQGSSIHGIFQVNSELKTVEVFTQTFSHNIHLKLKKGVSLNK